MKRFPFILLVVGGLIAAAVSFAQAESKEPKAVETEKIEKTTYDLVVVGGTPGGIACAVAAAREGIKVLLVNHTQHLGGFMTAGCGSWEAPYDGARSPIFDELKRRIAEYYREKFGEKSAQYLAALPDPTNKSRFGRPKVEPKVCELIIDQMVAAEPNITVLKGCYPAGADRQGELIKSVTLQEMHGSQKVIARGKIFADCMYEGDLAALAKVPYRVGRESRQEYGEPHAGIIFTALKPPKPEGQSDNTEIKLNIRSVGGPERRQGLEILPESTGEADGSVMSYNYRIILTKDPVNRVMVEKPANYDREKLGTSSRSIIPDIQNGKIAWNGGGRLVGPQKDYPEADWPKREEISRQYLDAMLGWLWFYQNDPTAKKEDQEFWKDYGLAKDEFPDNKNIPYEIYVREARRIVGQHVFTEFDSVAAPGIERSPVYPDSVAITDWPLDSTACTDREVRGKQEGRFMVADVWRPAQVPYRSILPTGVDNLLVPVCLSATHVGWGTIRLEPVWMQTGEAAGIAAAMAVKAGIEPVDVNIDQLLRRLAENGHMVSFFNDVDLASKASWNPAVQFFGTRGFFDTYVASPNEPLTGGMAKEWLSIFSNLLSGKPGDATAQARRLATDKPSAPVTKAAFMTDVAKALKEGNHWNERTEEILKAKGSPTGDLTRGDACQLLYELHGALVQKS